MRDDETNLKDLLKDPTLLETRSYVNGAWIDGEGFFDVTNPARGDVIAEVADLSRAQVATAIDAAHAAQKDWASWTGKERAGVLRRWYDLMKSG
jgi:succinate-semialdehyde dehydrogenase/glutarate-semialdehyde dehydrogenase